MYLGEIVRSILVALIDATPKPLLFSGHSSPVFNKQYGFDTSIMSAIEEAWIGSDSDPGAFVHPAFTADFKHEDLSPKVVAKLERIRQIIIHQAGVKEGFVSLRDAAVSDFYFCCFLDLNYVN
jgi:hexokinase